MGEGVVVRWLGRGYGRPVGGGFSWAPDTQFAVARGVELRSLRDFCLVSFLESKPLRLRSLKLTSVGLPTRYQLFTSG